MRIIDLAFQKIDASTADLLNKSRNWSGALVVREAAPATVVADIVDLNKPGLVVVVNSTDVICGALVPTTVIRRAQNYLPLNFLPNSFSGAVTEIFKRGTPQKYGHEWLNVQRPDWFWCDRGNHLSSQNPCTLRH